MTLEISREEWEELRELVRAAHAETNPEIHRAHHYEYRQRIHDRRDLLATLLKRLDTALEPVA